jgi:streptogramin lyase
LGIHEGLHKLDRKTGKFTTIYSKHGGVSTCMAEDLDKRLWIGLNGGLKCYDLKTKKYSTAQELFPSTPELQFAHSFGDLYCDKDGILWIGGNSGLVILNTKTGKAKSFVQDPGNHNSISSNGIYCLYDDENGHIWIGTTWGLNRFDKKTEQFVWYTVKDGLPDNNVVDILADENGHLWLSTEKGICKFTPPSSENKKAVCRNYNRSDGLPSDAFGRSLKGNDGTFYFSCNAGIVAFKPGELTDNPFIPPVLITDFSVFNKSVVPNDLTGILKLPADETKEIKLSYRQNDFSFTFTALSYIHPEKNQYAYKLENFDKEWTYTDATKRFATYTNIDPGEYIFRVKASNNDGIWNEEGTFIKLIITPPYWQTLSFKLLCVFAGGLKVCTTP